MSGAETTEGTTMSTEPLVLTEQESDMIRGQVVRDDEEGEVRVDLCPLCSGPTWYTTIHEAPRVVVAHLGESLCNNCQLVARMHPMVFDWIVAVIRGQKNLHRLLTKRA